MRRILFEIAMMIMIIPLLIGSQSEKVLEEGRNRCREVIKVCEMSKRVKEQEYVSKVRMAYERIEHQEIKSIEEE